MTYQLAGRFLSATGLLRVFAAAVALSAPAVLLVRPVLAQQSGVTKGSEQAVESAGSAVPGEQPSGNAGGSNKSSAGKTIEQIAASGRVLLIGESSSSRLSPAVRLAPGAPPILAFRYLDGQARHRFGDLDLVMDDAGH